MVEQNDIRTAFASLSAYPLRERLAIKLAGYLFYLVIKAVGSLTRFKINPDDRKMLDGTGTEQPIYAFWHDRMFLTVYLLRHLGALFLTSQSFDGEYLARIFQRFGYRIIRGSSSKGGSEAIAALTEAILRGRAASLTVDGPRGPRYESKVGAAVLAKRTGRPVVPLIVESRRFKMMNSWDRLRIPFPFSSAAVFLGDPIYVPADATNDEVEAARRKMQASLEYLTDRGQKWRTSR